MQSDLELPLLHGCVERCPRGVAPRPVIEAVRDTVVRMQNGNGIKAEDIPPIVDESHSPAAARQLLTENTTNDF